MNGSEINIPETAGAVGLGATVITLFGALLKGLLTGAPSQDRELRNDLSAEIKEMRAALAELRKELDEQREKHTAEMEAMQKKVSRTNAMAMYFMESRSEARILLREAQIQLNVEVKVWEPDPTFE